MKGILRVGVSCLFSLQLSFIGFAQSEIISTVAGNNRFIGDGGFATAASLSCSSGVAVDSSGNLYIADTGNNRVRKVTGGGIISTVAGNGDSGYSGDGGSATLAQLSVPFGVTVDSSGNLYIADSDNNCIRKVGMPNASFNLDLNTNGIGQTSTLGTDQNSHSGYATVAVKEGTVPYGTAVFSFKQNGVTVSEAGIPASPPTSASRIFIDYRSGVNAVPARGDAGVVDINTGIAVVNNGTATANVAYTLHDINGDFITSGTGTISGGIHFAKFIDQFTEIATGFILPEDFQTTIQFAALDIESDQPLSVTALRMTTNQRGEVLFTTTPVADMTKPLSDTPIYFPQLADGSGWTTSIILLNTSSGTENGTIDIFDNDGFPFVVNQAGGTAGSSFSYSIPSGGAFRFQTDGSFEGQKAGWVRLTPDNGSAAPIGSGVFSYNPVDVLITESGISSVLSTIHARIFVDLTENHNTGLTIANLDAAGANIEIQAFQADGVTSVGESQGALSLTGFGHDAKFANQFISGLPDNFIGVLDVSSSTPFAALTIRSLYNERGDFLITTFPVADLTRPAPSPIIFPQIADGGGYVTQFILLSAGGSADTTLNFYGEDGTPLAVGK